jgi:CheY-like chemotaxis protein
VQSAATESARTIVVADDEPQQRRLLCFRLAELGFDPLPAHDGQDALEKVRHFAPLAVIADALMPRLDGFALCRRLRESPFNERMPVILISSGDIHQEDRQLAAALGADAMAPRTPDFRETLRALSDCLATHGRPHPQQAPAEDWRGRFLTETHCSALEIAARIDEIDRLAAWRAAHRWAAVSSALGLTSVRTCALKLDRLLDEPAATVAEIRTTLEDLASRCAVTSRQ